MLEKIFSKLLQYETNLVSYALSWCQADAVTCWSAAVNAGVLLLCRQHANCISLTGNHLICRRDNVRRLIRILNLISCLSSSRCHLTASLPPLNREGTKTNRAEPQTNRVEPQTNRAEPDGFSRLFFLKSALFFFKSTLDFVRSPLGLLRSALVFLKSARGRNFDGVEHEKVARK